MKLGMKEPMVGLALAAALLAPGPAGAQEPGTISGTVRDATGLVLPGVTVEAQDAAGVSVPGNCSASVR